jgi:hypothetical protein
MGACALLMLRACAIAHAMCMYEWGHNMAGPGNDPVQVYRTGRANHWEFLRLWTGFELSSSWIALPDYGSTDR